MVLPRAQLDSALAEALGEPAVLVAAWANAPSVPRAPGRLVRLVYAFPSRRLATLRHWRDEAEFDASADGVTTHVVALEASKWARLLLKSHGGALLTSAAPPDVAALAAAAALPDLARTLWDETAARWAEIAGLEPIETAGEATREERFARVEGWLESVRAEIDDGSGPGRRPGAA